MANQIRGASQGKGFPAEGYAKATGRDSKPFRPEPRLEEVSPYLSGRALEEWRRNNPELAGDNYLERSATTIVSG